MRPRESFLLSQPVTVAGMPYASLTLRNPRRRDLAATYYGTELESGYRLIARLAGVPVAVILALAPTDLGTASNLVHASLDRLAPHEANMNEPPHAG